MTLTNLYPIILSEIDYAHKRFGRYHNAHELSAVLREEFEEHWDHVKANTADTHDAMYELIQVSAVALRYIMENGNENEISKIQVERHGKTK